MGVVKEVIYEIDFWSPPLKKHRYSMNAIERRTYVVSGTASGILMEGLQRRDKVASGILEKQDDNLKDLVDARDAPEEISDQDKKKESKSSRKFRSLQKKIDSMVYDYSAVRQGEDEDEVLELLNKDGFYDEILPLDYYLDAGETRARMSPSKMVLYIALMIAILAGTIFGLKTFIF